MKTQHIDTTSASLRELKLRSCRAELSTLAEEFASLTAREKVLGVFLPAARQKLDVLNRSTAFDAPADNILALLVENRRIELAAEAENEARARRAKLEQRLTAAFAVAGELLEPPLRNRSCRNRFANPGGEVHGKIPDALAEIDAALK
jgi:hypothetical protein